MTSVSVSSTDEMKIDGFFSDRNFTSGWIGATEGCTGHISFAVKLYYYLAPHRGRARYCNAHVCLCVCLCVCVCVCLSVFSQNFNKYFQNFRSKVKVVGRRKVKNVIWPYLGNEWS